MILVAATYGANNIGSGEEGTSSHPSTGSGCELGEGCVPASTQGRIARYACGPDYHDTIKPELYALDAFIRARTGRKTLGKVFVDTAPVLERDAAEQAGLGFIGRNCCLITPGLGSWTVLAGVMVPEVFDEGQTTNDKGAPDTGDDASLVDHPSFVLRHSSVLSHRASGRGCGHCTRCLDACPTRAFVAPHVLDARRCISYLTIELRGPIPRELRSSMGSWVFGCDVCQEVCPYNRVLVAQTAASAGRNPVHEGGLCGGSRDLQSPEIHLAELLALDEAGFRTRFRGTPVLRARRRGLVRNACVAAGNAGDTALVPALVSLLTDAEPLIRGHAAWALGQIGGEEVLRALELASALEADPWVCEEMGFSVLTDLALICVKKSLSISTLTSTST